MIVVSTSEMVDMLGGHNAGTWVRSNVSGETVAGVSVGEFEFGKWDALEICRTVMHNEGKFGALEVLDRLNVVLAGRNDGMSYADYREWQDARDNVLILFSHVTGTRRAN